MVYNEWQKKGYPLGPSSAACDAAIYSGEAYAKNVIVVGAQESYRPTYSYVVSENNFKGSLLRSDPGLATS